MNAIKRLFSISVLAVLMNAALPQASQNIESLSIALINVKLTEHLDEDCYRYDRVYINGQWWIYVYDCDGVFVKAYPENEF